MHTLTDEGKASLYIACTLAEAMKDCKACAFACGLPARMEWLESIGKADKERNKS